MNKQKELDKLLSKLDTINMAKMRQCRYTNLRQEIMANLCDNITELEADIKMDKIRP